MKVVHKTTLACRCPINDAIDLYEVRFETYRLLKVEDILAAIEALPEKVFQENLTETLAVKLGCVVITTGYHSGIKTTCTA